MQNINPDTKMTIFMQCQFVLAVPLRIERLKCVEFHKSLLEAGLDIEQTNSTANSFMLRRTDPSRLQVKIDAPAPQLTGILVTAVEPESGLEVFIQEAGAVTSAYQQTWPGQRYQVVRSAVKLQHLYACTEHSFKHLWENRLGQSAGDFKCLGGPVAGGGLRLVLPPHKKGDEVARSVELRYESYFKEPNKILIETGFVWPEPVVVGHDENLSPEGRLRQADNYAVKEAIQFLNQ